MGGVENMILISFKTMPIELFNNGYDFKIELSKNFSIMDNKEDLLYFIKEGYFINKPNNILKEILCKQSGIKKSEIKDSITKSGHIDLQYFLSRYNCIFLIIVDTNYNDNICYRTAKLSLAK